MWVRVLPAPHRSSLVLILWHRRQRALLCLVVWPSRRARVLTTPHRRSLVLILCPWWPAIMESLAKLVRWEWLGLGLIAILPHWLSLMLMSMVAVMNISKVKCVIEICAVLWPVVWRVEIRNGCVLAFRWRRRWWWHWAVFPIRPPWWACECQRKVNDKHQMKRFDVPPQTETKFKVPGF